MIYKFLPFIIMMFSISAFSADIFIGHAYSFKCPYYGCDKVENYARPLFKKSQNGWQVFPNGKDVGSTPDALWQSYKLFPDKIQWNIFDHDQSLIGEELVENKKPAEWWINVGAGQMQFDFEKIKQNSDKTGYYSTSDDLILSTNKNIVFFKFKTRETTDIKVFESSMNHIKDVINKIDPNVTIEKKAAIYSVENVDVLAILDFEQISDEMIDTNSVVLVKTGDKWEFAFDGKSIDYDKENVAFLLKTIADFDNDGKREYIFTLSSGVNGFGYILWQDGIEKPLVYRYYSH